ncbi:hypothetical protein M9H77_35406 [Catharanthus roseus]|uniref:Uncharacterized protein n=1 Tax=Catharanthus roseus TaxID=4058 RepID=A0ACB9ZNY5_CATRO|nr:hypothetical protein M9H77_35406 [Catharanthus roseus]
MSSCSGKKKSSWPELVGAPATVAFRIIERQNKDVNATIVDDSSFVSGDFRCDRVRIFVNRQNFVTRTPRVG